MFSRFPRFRVLIQHSASAVERSISASADFSSMTSKPFNSFIVHSTDFILPSKCSSDFLDSASSFYRLHSTFKMFSRFPRFRVLIQHAASAVERSISAAADFSSMTSKPFNSFIVHSTDFILHSKCSADVLDSLQRFFNVQLQQ